VAKAALTTFAELSKSVLKIVAIDSNPDEMNWLASHLLIDRPSTKQDKAMRQRLTRQDSTETNFSLGVSVSTQRKVSISPKFLSTLPDAVFLQRNKGMVDAP